MILQTRLTEWADDILLTRFPRFFRIDMKKKEIRQWNYKYLNLYS